eukprot:NODE_939_length_2999_cov_0.589310.p3 type:complete len:121 gc:universal NODE_939_length_2999_cov_0.589310:80-442(+)
MNTLIMLFTVISALSIIDPKPTFPTKPWNYCIKQYATDSTQYLKVDKTTYVQQCIPPYQYCLNMTKTIKFANNAAAQAFIISCTRKYKYCLAEFNKLVFIRAPTDDEKQKYIQNCIHTSK